MYPFLHCRSFADFQNMSQHDLDAVLAGARALQHAARAADLPPMLKGRNIGLMIACDGDDALLFCRAAGDLGARVSVIRSTLSVDSTAAEIQHTARVLGRLYDAVECQGIAHDLIEQLSDAAGVPVFDGMATAQHPTARLAERLDGETSDDNRRFVLQAVLLGSIA
jgi:ornithine carbamoyltransferase